MCLPSYSITEYLLDINSRTEAPTLIAYFYYSRNSTEPARADPNEILRSILRHLSSTKIDLPIRRPVADFYRQRKEEAEEDGEEVSRLDTAECVELILALLEETPAFIIIDALDESAPTYRHVLLQALDEITQRSLSLVKVFVSS